jgi:hypothetical protein
VELDIRVGGTIFMCVGILITALGGIAFGSVDVHVKQHVCVSIHGHVRSCVYTHAKNLQTLFVRFYMCKMQLTFIIDDNFLLS